MFVHAYAVFTYDHGAHTDPTLTPHYMGSPVYLQMREFVQLRVFRHGLGPP